MTIYSQKQPIRALPTIAQWLILLTIVAAASCHSQNESTLTLATTTSAQDSGLLDLLVPVFQSKTGIRVKVVAVGSGQAFNLGRRGDADVLLVHDPNGEQKFVDEGYGVSRQLVMFNDFVLVGPPADPAGIRDCTSVKEAFIKIAASEVPFISRGDESGTHQKEKQIWHLAESEPNAEFYFRAGAGMAHVLRITDEKHAYTISDRGTFLSHSARLNLSIVCQGDSILTNPYHVILVSPEKHPHVQLQAARKFSEFLLSAETQKTINEFGKDLYGEPLFHTNEDVHASSPP